MDQAADAALVPDGGNDAARAAANLAGLLHQRYPNAPYKITNNGDTSEVMIDFLLPMPESNQMEFNIFKYAPAGNGLVALQFGRRPQDRRSERRRARQDSSGRARRDGRITTWNQ